MDFIKDYWVDIEFNGDKCIHLDRSRYSIIEVSVREVRDFFDQFGQLKTFTRDEERNFIIGYQDVCDCEDAIDTLEEL